MNNTTAAATKKSLGTTRASAGSARASPSTASAGGGTSVRRTSSKKSTTFHGRNRCCCRWSSCCCPQRTCCYWCPSWRQAPPLSFRHRPSSHPLCRRVRGSRPPPRGHSPPRPTWGLLLFATVARGKRFVKISAPGRKNVTFASCKNLTCAGWRDNPVWGHRLRVLCSPDRLQTRQNHGRAPLSFVTGAVFTPIATFFFTYE